MANRKLVHIDIMMKVIMNKKVFCLGMLAIIVSSGFVLLSGCGKGKQQHAMQMPPMPVEATKATQHLWYHRINSVGTLLAKQGIMIKPEVSGRITRIFFQSGQYVQAGTPLLETNPEISKAQLAYDRARLESSAPDFKRKHKLIARGAISLSQVDDAKSARDSDQANIAKDKALLNESIIRAPFSGRIGLRLIDVGDYITAGTTKIANLQAIDPLRVEFTIPEVNLRSLQIGEKISVHSDSYPNKSFIGSVYAFDSAIDPQTRSISVRAYIPNKNHILLPGMFVDVTLLAQPQTVISIPQTAIIYSPQHDAVYKIVKGKTVLTPVVLGKRRGADIAIKQGLQTGDLVVTAGQVELKDHAPVLVTNMHPPKKTGSVALHKII